MGRLEGGLGHVEAMLAYVDLIEFLKQAPLAARDAVSIGRLRTIATRTM
jgi:hypothetical protein